MELRQLLYFLRAVELKSISKAAEQCHIAQPALGMHLRKLEYELGVTLLTRHTRGVEPTEAGLVLFARAQELVDHAGRIKQELVDFKGPARGQIRLGLPSSINAMIGSAVVKRCKEEFPAVSLDILENTSSVLIEWIVQNRVDIAIAYPADSETCHSSESLLEEDFFFAGPPGAAISSRKPIALADIARYPLVLSGTAQGVEKLLEPVASDTRISLNIAMQVSSVFAVRDFVERGFGFGIFPFGVVKNSVHQGTLFARRIVRPSISRRLNLFYAARTPQSKARDAVRGIIQKLVLEECVRSNGSWRIVPSEKPSPVG